MSRLSLHGFGLGAKAPAFVDRHLGVESFLLLSQRKAGNFLWGTNMTPSIAENRCTTGDACSDGAEDTGCFWAIVRIRNCETHRTKSVAICLLSTRARCTGAAATRAGGSDRVKLGRVGESGRITCTIS